MREKIIKLLENIRWGEYLPEEVVADQILSAFKEMVEEDTTRCGACEEKISNLSHTMLCQFKQKLLSSLTEE